MLQSDYNLKAVSEHTLPPVLSLRLQIVPAGSMTGVAEQEPPLQLKLADKAGSAEPSNMAADKETTSALYAAQRGPLYRYLRRMLSSHDDAQEAVQETFVRVLRQPGSKVGNANPVAYVFQTATNLARDLLRSRVRAGRQAEQRHIAMEGLHAPDWHAWPELAQAGEEMLETVLGVLETMKEPMRSALLLYRFDGLSHREIARYLDVSERTVERYIETALTRIADALEIARDR